MRASRGPGVALATLAVGLALVVAYPAAASVPPTMDGRVAKHEDGPFAGAHIYDETGVGQTRSKPIVPGQVRNFFYRATNRGPGTDMFLLHGNDAPPCFRFRYFIQGVDVTKGFVETGIGDPGIPVGETIETRLEMKAKACVAPGSKATIKVDAEPTQDVDFDRVRARVRRA